MKKNKWILIYFFGAMVYWFLIALWINKFDGKSFLKKFQLTVPLEVGVIAFCVPLILFGFFCAMLRKRL